MVRRNVLEMLIAVFTLTAYLQLFCATCPFILHVRVFVIQGISLISSISLVVTFQLLQSTEVSLCVWPIEHSANCGHILSDYVTGLYELRSTV